MLSCKKEVNFKDYYFNLNLAKIAYDEKDFKGRNHFLWEAYNSFPMQDKVSLPFWLYRGLLNTFDENDPSLKVFIDKNYAVINDTLSFLNGVKPSILSDVLKNQKYTKLSKYAISEFEDLNQEIDTLYALDQYFCGYKSNVDTNLILKKYRKYFNSSDGGCSSPFVFDRLSAILDKFGYIGNRSCPNCQKISFIYVHIDNYDYFMKINDYLLYLVKNGYLTPNEYAWAFDRSYNQKFGTFYYYFSMNYPFNTENYIFIENLTENEKKIINQRREEIGIPPLPFEFTFVNKYYLGL